MATLVVPINTRIKIDLVLPPKCLLLHQAPPSQDSGGIVHPHSTGVSTYKACEEGCFLQCPQSPLVRLHHGEVLTLVPFPPGNNFAPTSASTHSHLLPFPNDDHRCRASALMMPPLCHLSTWAISPATTRRTGTPSMVAKLSNARGWQGGTDRKTDAF